MIDKLEGVAWAKFHDGFDDDPDIDRLSGDAIALFVCSVTWSSRSLTDGFIPEARARRFPGGTPEAIEMLCLGEKPWWVGVEGGYRIRSFHKYNPTADEVRENREQVSAVRSEAGRKGMQSRWQRNNKTDNKTPGLLLTSDNKNITPGPVSRFPYSESQNPKPKNRNSHEFRKEPEAGRDYELRCVGDDAVAKMFKPGTNEPFDPGEWFDSRNLTPTRRWEDHV